MEFEKKRELERRKTLRLLQVRQQAKDFSCKLRENIQAEMIYQKNKFLQSKTKQIQKQHLEELKKLKEVYEKRLQTIGESHREAAKQPNLDCIKQAQIAKLSKEAAVRGARARKQQFEKEKQIRHELEAPLKQKKATRNRENLRSYFISTLPKQSTLGNQSMCHKNQSSQTSESTGNNQVLQEIPSNLLNQHPSRRRNFNESDHKYNKNIKSDITYRCNQKQLEDNPTEALLPNDCSCDYVVCPCHDSPKEIRRRCISESRVSIASSASKEEREANKVKLRSRSCSPRSVKTLNYCDVGNLYESNQPSFVKVTHHSASPKGEKDNFDARVEPNLHTEKRSNNEELKKKTEERSAKALHREQLKRDFEQLLQDLGHIAREKLALKKKTKATPGVYQRERDIIQKNEAKQRKLTEAFEILLHTEKQNNQPRNIDSAQQSEKFGTGESSPPTLNLALYHQVNMTSRGSSPTQQGTLVRRIISSEEITISQSSIPVNPQSQRSPPSRSPPPSQATTRTPMGSPKPLAYSYPPSGSPRREQPRETSPEVLVRSNPSGSVHLTVKVQSEGRQHKKKCKRGRSSPKLDSSSSYFSPPDSLTPSQKLLLDALLIQVNKRALNKDLKKYIKKLLSMSRESIDDLNVSSSSGCIDPARNSPEKEIQDDIVKLSELTELYADKVNKLVDMFENFEQLEIPEQFDATQFFDPAPSTSKVSQPPRVPPPSRLPVPRDQSPVGHRVPSPASYRAPSPATRGAPRSSDRRVPSPGGRRAPSPISYRAPSPATRGATSPSDRRVPSPGGRRAPSPISYRAPSPANRRTASPTTPLRSHTPSPTPRLPRKPTTPPIQRRPRRPQTPDPPVRQVGYPPSSADSRIPRLQSPERSPTPQPQRQGTPPAAFQTPFGLSSNLLPHPQDAFPQRPAALSPSSEPSFLRGLEELAPYTDNGRNTSSMFRELYPDVEIKTPGSSWDFYEQLEKHGLAKDFKRPRPQQEFLQTVDSSSLQSLECNTKDSQEKKNTPQNKSPSADVYIQEEQFMFNTFQNDDVSRQPSPLNFENIRQRLSDVCNEHYMAINTMLADETEEERERLIKEVWGTDHEFVLVHNESNSTKSLALLQALKSSS